MCAKEWEKLTDEFDAVSEDGKVFHLLVYTTMLDVTDMDNPDAPPAEGLQRCCTSECYPCRKIDDDTWEIMIRVTRVVKR